jgi:hypothetical protein
MVTKSARKSALRFNPDWKSRHRNRDAVANKPGCRQYVKQWAEGRGLRLRTGTIWSIRKSRRKPAIAVWNPYAALLEFPTLGQKVHVHDVLGVCHEIQLRSAALGLRTK